MTARHYYGKSRRSFVMVASSPTMTESTAPARPGALTLPRILGTIGMVTSPFLFLSFAANGFKDGDSNQLGAALGLVFSLGWFSSALGLYLLGATGRRLPARILLGIEVVGTILASIFQVYEFLAPGSDSILYTITDIAWPLSMLTLLITGIVAIFARRFEGWLRFTPLFAALWLPLAIVELPLLGQTAGQALGGLHTTLGWFLIAYAVFRAGKLTARD
jgi:hypothetical protein